jgi:alpha-N-arabinofuranosidase
MRSAKRVRAACLAQMVNVIAPITTNPQGFFRQTIYYPYAWALQCGRGDVLDLAVESVTYNTSRRNRVPYIDAAGTIDKDTGTVSLFILNRDLDKDREVELVWRETPPQRVLFSQVLSGPDLKAFNSFENPQNVAPQPFDAPRMSTRTTFKVPARSYTVIQFGS